MSDLNVNHRDSKHTCFWNFIHVKTATKFVCSLALLGYLLSTIGLFLHNYKTWHHYIEIVRVILGTFSFANVFAGIHLKAPRCLLICLVWIASRMIFHTAQILLCLIAYFPESPLEHVQRHLMGSFLRDRNITKSEHFIRFVAMLVLYIVIFDLIYKCYKYIAEKAATSDKEILPHSTVLISQESKTSV
uniref:Uncharacterized protein n=1 Tax=Panagrolaimus superbus TaxID=310955 RepID=A0A914YUM5_9BILA